MAALTGVVPASAAPAGPASTTSWLHTEGSRILTDSGEDFTIRGVNWFGMETSNCAPHGLWQISLDQAMDQIAAFGFNAIRLPFSSECVAESASSVSGVDPTLNPDLHNLTPLAIMDKVVAAASARGMRIILDRHRPDSGAQSELWYTERFSEQQWISDWVSLATRYADNPTVIGADLHNEPHGQACWGCADPARDFSAAATRAGNAILAVDPHLLIVVEGVEHQKVGGSTWWGGGLADVAAHPITLEVPHQLVYSAHDYPASIFAQTWFADPDYPANLPAVWDANWGYLQQQDIAPVLLGEFGSKLTTTSDQQWLATLVTYLGERKMSFAYWSYNPNSGDTGGLVADDWRTPQQAKLDALAPLLRPAAVPATPITSPSPGTGTTAPTTTPGGTGSASPAPTTTAAAVPSNAPPSGTASQLVPTSTPPQLGLPGTVGVQWQLQSSWPTGYVAQLVVTAAAAVDGWTASWPDSHATSVAGSWGMKCTVSAGTIRCSGTDWAAAIPAGGSVQVGLQVTTDGVAPVSPPVTTG